MKITPHFTYEELQCQCGCGQMLFTQAAVEHLETLRVDFRRPIYVNSGYRCPDHNEAVSSSGRRGPHTQVGHSNITVDIGVADTDAYDLLTLATQRERGWTGIGVRQRGTHPGRFIHLDRLSLVGPHPRPRVWSY